MACDWANRAFIEADDLYESKSSDSSDVLAEPVPTTVATEDEEEVDDIAPVCLLRNLLYSSVDRIGRSITEFRPFDIIFNDLNALLRVL